MVWGFQIGSVNSCGGRQQVYSMWAVFSHAVCISCFQSCGLHQMPPPIAVEYILIWRCRYPSDKTLDQSSFTCCCWISYCVCVISFLTCTCMQHCDSHPFCPCNSTSESVINLVTTVLCIQCYNSVSKYQHLARICYTFVMSHYHLYWRVSDLYMLYIYL
jgi:hypothetical protein